MVELDALPGETIESIVFQLESYKSMGKSVTINYKGHKLSSDTTTLESAYLEVTGKTKEEFLRTKYDEYIQRGQSLIFPQRHQKWEECVVDCMKIMAQGYVLDDALDLMQALENGEPIEEVAKTFNAQGHSGNSENLVRKILLTFSKRGPEFWEVTHYGEITPEIKAKLEARKQENIVLAKSNTNGDGQNTI